MEKIEWSIECVLEMSDTILNKVKGFTRGLLKMKMPLQDTWSLARGCVLWQEWGYF